MQEQTVDLVAVKDRSPVPEPAPARELTVSEVRRAIRQARRERGSGETVLDRLLRVLRPLAMAEADPVESPSHADLAAVLLAASGVQATFDDEGYQLWLNHPALRELVAVGMVPLKHGASEALWVGAADPWDADISAQATAVLRAEAAGAFVALPARLLHPWVNAATARLGILEREASGATAGRTTAAGDSESSSLPFGRGIRAAPGDDEMDRLEAMEGYGFDQGIVVMEEDHQPAEVVTFVNQALHSAFVAGASDVHFEYSRSGMTVKLRQDGVMTYHSSISGMQRAEEVISRIKVLAQLDITERRVPQDGRFRFRFAGGELDLRVSIMPSVFGEDAVLRLLDKAQLRSTDVAVSLDLLGFDEQSVQAIRNLSELPHGMMLITGPTGSGKTTTVYGILSEVNTGDEKIITIEDPVEYELSGVLQIPVNEKKGLTFARGLRSILRHDPDRILVGEIRDAETAEIAVQSALTGHQVFTTVHANSVFDVTGRFKHFGLDMFGFMSALNGVIVQRLVRRVCPHCATSRVPNAREAEWLSAMKRPLQRVPTSAGCSECRQTGYRGRLVIAEVHRVDDRLRDLVTLNAPVSQLREHVMQAGVLSLAEQGARLIAEGMTTTEEIKRVVGWY
ncbi:GspE/PulE family protein [Roseateles puraquae]|nr:GspE/PulE family protein [Roseateles puraquae]